MYVFVATGLDRGRLRYQLLARKTGDPGAIRTRDPQIRNLVLYPTELRDLISS